MDHFDLIGCTVVPKTVGDGTDEGDDRVRSCPVFHELVGISSFERWDEHNCWATDWDHPWRTTTTGRADGTRADGDFP